MDFLACANLSQLRTVIQISAVLDFVVAVNNSNNNNRWYIIDISIPGNSRIEEKDLEKITKYKDLQTEIEMLWQKKTKRMPVVTGDLSVIPQHFEEHLNSIGAIKITIHQQ